MTPEELARGIRRIYAADKDDLLDEEVSILMARMADANETLEAALARDPLLRRYLEASSESIAELRILNELAAMSLEKPLDIDVPKRPDKPTVLEKIQAKIDQLIDFSGFQQGAVAPVRGQMLNLEPAEIEIGNGILIELDPAVNETDSAMRDLFVRLEDESNQDFEGVEVEVWTISSSADLQASATIDKYNETVIRSLMANTVYAIQIPINNRMVQIREISIP
ncbi:MAG: hypothetical protein AAF902_14685 [Chloroflexota bacterium]